MAPRRSPGRFLAPLALAAFALAFLVIVLSSGVLSGGSDSQSGSTETTQQARERNRDAFRSNGKPKRVYVVKSGDSLVGIAEKTGISVERLQELNPDVDPQALIAMQRLKLR